MKETKYAKNVDCGIIDCRISVIIFNSDNVIVALKENILTLRKCMLNEIEFSWYLQLLNA
jgi:hypothetical protein